MCAGQRSRCPRHQGTQQNNSRQTQPTSQTTARGADNCKTCLTACKNMQAEGQTTEDATDADRCVVDTLKPLAGKQTRKVSSVTDLIQHKMQNPQMRCARGSNSQFVRLRSESFKGTVSETSKLEVEQCLWKHASSGILQQMTRTDAQKLACKLRVTPDCLHIKMFSLRKLFAVICV